MQRVPCVGPAAGQRLTYLQQLAAVCCADVMPCCGMLRWAQPLQGRCWVEGDNQEHSGDSKTAFGPVRTPA